MYISKPIQLRGTYNTRDLGGYETVDKRITKKNKILRSDGLQNLSREDVEALYAYGVRLIIDLRSDWEIKHSPCVMVGYKDVQYVHVPMLDRIQSNKFMDAIPESLSSIYLDLLENKQACIAKVLRAVISIHSGCVLYNCTVGKDRTGVISMLILLLSGLPEKSVLHDYEVTYENVKPMTQKQKENFKKLGADVPDYLFESPAEQMKIAIDWLIENYGSVENYLVRTGLSADEIFCLKNKLF